MHLKGKKKRTDPFRIPSTAALCSASGKYVTNFSSGSSPVSTNFISLGINSLGIASPLTFVVNALVSERWSVTRVKAGHTDKKSFDLKDRHCCVL